MSAHLSTPLSETGAEGRTKTPTGLPFGLVIGVFTGLAVLATSVGELRDIDLYWHLLAGEELASGGSPRDVGADWSLQTIDGAWTSTQWLAELVLFGLHEVGGWTAIASIRLLTAAVAFAVLATTTLRGRPKALASLPYMTAVAAVALVAQERPQQATIVGAAVLGGVILRGLEEDALPRWYLLLPATVLWANLHGGWVLVPAVMVIIALARMADWGVGDPTAIRALALGAGACAAGAATPSGIAGLTAALRFSEAADGLAEWQSTQPVYSIGIFTTVMMAIIVVAWARTPGRVARSEVVVTLTLLVFGWTAWRNVAPALSMLAPLAAHRLCATYPKVGRPEPRWSVPLGITAAVLLTLAGLWAMVGRVHLPASSQPLKLASQVSELPPGQRVLNFYRVAGLVLYFGGAETQVAIDGRADRFGAERIRAYTELMQLRGQWADLLNELQPTSALIESDVALAHELVDVRGWKVLGSENGYVLLVPPS